MIIPSIWVSTALSITLVPLHPPPLHYFFCHFAFVPACATFAILRPSCRLLISPPGLSLPGFLFVVPFNASPLKIDADETLPARHMFLLRSEGMDLRAVWMGAGEKSFHVVSSRRWRETVCRTWYRTCCRLPCECEMNAVCTSVIRIVV